MAREANGDYRADVWTVRYFDKRVNRDETSRDFTSEDAAMHQACDLLRKGMRVDRVQGPGNRRIRTLELVSWCKSHRSPEKPKD